MSKFKAAIPKWCKNTSNNLIENQEIISSKRIRNFNEIPGPKAFPLIGNTFRFIPGMAQFSNNNTVKLLQQLQEKYGDIVKLVGLPLKRPIVFLFSPSLARGTTPTKYFDCAIKRLEDQPVPEKFYVNMLQGFLQQMSEEEAKTVIRRELVPGAIDTVADSENNTLKNLRIPKRMCVCGKYSGYTNTALYAIATNPRVQAKLFVELRVVLPNVDSPFTAETSRNVPYLKVCLKETTRMFPILLGNVRTMTRDIDLGGFTVPEGVCVFASHSTMGQRSEQFPEPQKFIPERWLDDFNKRSTSEAHGYAVLPFGKGPRTCVGRYLAMREITVFIARIVRTFELQWRYEPLRFQYQLIATVQSPFKIKITDR